MSDQNTPDFVLTPEAGGYVATDPATGCCSQGDTREDATANLREAVAVWTDEFGSAA